MTTPLAIGMIVAGVGIAVWRANPRRPANQLFMFGALALSLNHVLVHGAIQAGLSYALTGVGNPIPWIRASGMVGALYAWFLWLLRESILHRRLSTWALVRRLLPWTIVPLALSLIVLSEAYMPSDSLPGRATRGWAYYFWAGFQVVLYIALIWDTMRERRHRSGIDRIELQFFILSAAIGGVLATVFSVAGNYFQLPLLKSVSFTVTAVPFLATAWGLSAYRVFDARYILFSIGQRIALGFFATGIGLALYELWKFFGPVSGFAIPVCAALSLALAIWLDPRFRRWLGLDQASVIEGFRDKVMAIARAESKFDDLVAKLEHLLATRLHSRRAYLCFEQSPSTLAFPTSGPLTQHLAALEWATPERLVRMPSTPETTAVGNFMSAHTLGLLLCVPRGSPSPSLVLALAPKQTDYPFTYLEVQQLQVIGELIDHLFTRSRLISQAALRARMDHLAMVSRGLAHDLKNLITPVATFLVHTDGRYPPDTDEAEVHAAARRSVRIMSDYLREALAFSERMQPRFEAVELDPVFAAARHAVAARATRRQIDVEIRSEVVGTFVADAVLLQRLFANLLSNAIDASSPGQTVRLAAGRHGDRLRVTVSDAGTGIAAEHLPRIFEPYFTTKEFGDEVRGFGLGLTICQKIAALHSGAITVQSAPGLGTTIIVDIPPQRTDASSLLAIAQGRS